MFTFVIQPTFRECRPAGDIHKTGLTKSNKDVLVHGFNLIKQGRLGMLRHMIIVAFVCCDHCLSCPELDWWVSTCLLYSGHTSKKQTNWRRLHFGHTKNWRKKCVNNEKNFTQKVCKSRQKTIRDKSAVQSWWFSRSQPKFWRKMKTNGGVRTQRTLTFWMYDSGTAWLHKEQSQSKIYPFLLISAIQGALYKGSTYKYTGFTEQFFQFLLVSAIQGALYKESISRYRGFIEQNL